EAGGDFRGFAGEVDGGAAAFFADDFKIDPADAATPARPERFHGCFFGSEAAGVAFELVLEALAIFDFVGRENAAQERLAVAPDGRLDPRDLGDLTPKA